MTTTTIAVQIKSNKPFVGRITGTDARFGFALDFLPLTRKSAGYHTAEITEAGQYKVIPGTTVAARRIDTGYIRVDDAGTVTEITKDEVTL